MAEKKSAVSRYLTEIGRKGGKAKVAKGFAKVSKKRRREIARQGAAARWGEKKGAKP
jgi:general stress protein YciG